MSKTYNFEVTREDVMLMTSAVEIYVANAKRAYNEKRISSQSYLDLLIEADIFFDKLKPVARQIRKDIDAQEAEKNGEERTL